MKTEVPRTSIVRGTLLTNITLSKLTLAQDASEDSSQSTNVVGPVVVSAVAGVLAVALVIAPHKAFTKSLR